MPKKQNSNRGPAVFTTNSLTPPNKDIFNYFERMDLLLKMDLHPTRQKRLN